MTAVEWLKKELEEYGTNADLELDWTTFDKLVDQAKEMEKEQIIDSFDEARTYVLKNVWKHDYGKRYYQETYGKQYEKTNSSRMVARSIKFNI